MAKLGKWLWMLWLAWPGLTLPNHELLHEGASEQSVLAAMTFNLLRFTEGIRGEDGQIRLCVAGGDIEQMRAFQRLEGRSLKDRALSVQRLSRNASCHVIFVAARQHWKEVVEYRDAPLMTLGGYRGAIADGATIEILFEAGRPRFEISLSEARRAQLRFQPQLLRLAKQVHD